MLLFLYANLGPSIKIKNNNSVTQYLKILLKCINGGNIKENELTILQVFDRHFFKTLTSKLLNNNNDIQTKHFNMIVNLLKSKLSPSYIIKLKNPTKKIL